MKNTAPFALNPFIGLPVVSRATSALLNDGLPAQVFATVHHGGGILLMSGTALNVLLIFGRIKNNQLRCPGAKA